MGGVHPGVFEKIVDSGVARVVSLGEKGVIMGRRGKQSVARMR